MAFPGLEDMNLSDGGIETIMTFPLSGDPYFWGKILFGLWLIIGFSFFFEEKKRLGKGNILSAFAVSSIGIIVLAYIGSLFNIITGDVFVSTIVLGIIFIAIWFLKGK